ncbi:MAG: tetratricopeptide repeat protein [Acidobacteria bacterium]|nr:tetratricopeptide repeat protein [Acidobacteriota bacterium]
MSFDKTKALRNAERFLAQGKIRAAIGEYKQMVANDPKDFGTLNILGDLYVKNSEKDEAVKCFKKVAEYYAKQGFSQKAIAVYNKLSKLEPKSVETSERLAELYKTKGSPLEARSHYLTLARHYQSKGRPIEALAIWKQVALIEPDNMEVFLTIAQSYIDEKAFDEAIQAFIDGATRFNAKGDYQSAESTLERAFAINARDSRAWAAFVIKLVEVEPSSYSKFLTLADAYLKINDTVGATRMLSMSSEHALVGGKADEFKRLVEQILELDPEQLDALRLLVRYYTWQRDEAAFRRSLERLVKAATNAGSVDDERFALSQLVTILPHEVSYADRLREINEEFGFDSDEPQESLFDARFFKVGSDTCEIVVDETATTAAGQDGHLQDDFAAIDFEDYGKIEKAADAAEVRSTNESDEEVTGDAKLEREIESIRFYVANGYHDLAAKAINELRSEFGERSEIDELQTGLAAAKNKGQNEPEPRHPEARPDLETAKAFVLEDLRAEFGLEDAEQLDDEDYETRYHTAVAYQEMGLLEVAIKEFQEAVSLVPPNDGTRRFFQCSILLGHCFMQLGKPNLAVTWFKRSLETPSNFRDVSERVRNLVVSH